MKKGRIVILLFTLLYSYALFGQTGQAYDCIVLQKSIAFTEFIDHFYINKSKETLEIVDTSFYFVNCDEISKIGERPLVISRNYPLNVDVNRGSGIENKNKIIIYNVTKHKYNYKISFWQPYSNATLVLQVRLKKRHTKIKVLSAGVF